MVRLAFLQCGSALVGCKLGLHGASENGIKGGISAYFEPGITITRVALSSFFADGEPPRVTSEEPSGEVDQDAPELLRV